MVWKLIKNPVYTTMVIGWMFGSYLVGGYSTYLPKYIETQYARSASSADIYAGIYNATVKNILFRKNCKT